MLMSFSEKFVFLGNPKAASSTMEDFLYRRCEIVSSTSEKTFPHTARRPNTKHLSYRDWVRLNRKLFARIDQAPENFLVFGVVREPMDRLASRYFYRQRLAEKRSEEKPSIEAFVAELLESPEHVFSQRAFFADAERGIGANFLIRLDRGEADIARLREETGLDIAGALGAVRNPSEREGFAIDSAELRARIEERLAADRDLYDNHAGRLLKPVAESPPVAIEKALRIMAKGVNSYDFAATFLQNVRRRLREGEAIDVRRLIDLSAGRSGADGRD